jgi:ribosomal protein S18 acetylase RimI-like enzyme
MNIRRLTPLDAQAFQGLRLAALRDTPTAFASSYEEEKDFPLATVQGRLALRADRGAFGAFLDDTLVGIVVLGRAEQKKVRHKALIWSVYVAPHARGRGIGRALLQEAVSLARSVPEFRQVNVGVNAGNAVAIRLYESLGFRAYALEPGALLIDGEPHDELHLFLPLPAG